MASIKDDTATVKEEFDALSTPTQIFVATLVAIGIVIGVLIGLWLAVETLDDADPAQAIEWNDNTYRLDDSADAPEGDTIEGG